MGSITNSARHMPGAKGRPIPVETDVPFWQWFPGFLREELVPYPGRASLVVRMVVAATITVLIIMTFRLPGAGIAAYYTLLLSRDSPQTTMRSALTVLAGYAASTVYLMIGILLFIDKPLLHFVFVIFSLFLAFYLIKTVTNYVAGAAVAFTISIVLPIWDQIVPTSELVTATLWAVSSVTVGLASTVAVEYVYHMFVRRDELVYGLADRLDAVCSMLSQCCGKDIDPVAAKRVAHYGVVGVSRLRRMVTRQGSQVPDFVRRAAVVSLVGRLIDVCNAILHLPHEPSPEDEARLRQIAKRVRELRDVIGEGHRLGHYEAAKHHEEGVFPLLPELERTVQLLAVNLTKPAEDEPVEQDHRPVVQTIFAKDALTNPDHYLFSLRGCLAASTCYLIMNAVAWPGLGTSLATCIVTALSSIGSSRQKQMLRFAGTVLGGLVFGIGAQILILPGLDSIGGFLILVAVVTAVAAWISTSSARLSYLGSQTALAFYLIHLQEYYPQTNLAIGRDRVMGVALGLVAMWLLFDQIGTRPAAEVMRETFGQDLKLLAKLAEPWPADGLWLTHGRVMQLRDQIQNNFAAVNAQADAVLFEVGPERRAHLLLRRSIRSWQPSLRTLFVIQAALLQYKLDADPWRIPPAHLEAQRNFDRQQKLALEGLARAFVELKEPAPASDLLQAYAELDETVRKTYEVPPTRTSAVLDLSSHVVDVIVTLEGEFRRSWDVIAERA